MTLRESLFNSLTRNAILHQQPRPALHQRASPPSQAAGPINVMKTPSKLTLDVTPASDALPR
eukprot:1427255-Amphidinium_carterae.1